MDVEALEALYMDAIRSSDTKRAMAIKRQLDEARSYEEYKQMKVKVQELDEVYKEKVLEEQKEVLDPLEQRVGEIMDKILAERANER